MTVLTGLVLSLALSTIPQATAWGSLGHRTVAYLAQKHLTTDGAAFVNNLLGDEDISDAALWPDQIRRTTGWTYTAGWHFIGRCFSSRIHSSFDSDHYLLRVFDGTTKILEC